MCSKNSLKMSMCTRESVLLIYTLSFDIEREKINEIISNSNNAYLPYKKVNSKKKEIHCILCQ